MGLGAGLRQLCSSWRCLSDSRSFLSAPRAALPMLPSLQKAKAGPQQSRQGSATRARCLLQTPRSTAKKLG